MVTETVFFFEPLWCLQSMATSDENTALNSAKNKSQSIQDRIQRNSSYGTTVTTTTASSFDSVEGLTPSGYEINPCQLSMVGCWLTLGIIPNLAALIVGFEHDDILCNNNFNNYGFIHPHAYLKITGIIGILISILTTCGILYLMRYNPEIMEIIVNGKICEFNHPIIPNIRNNKLIILNKLFAMSLILVSFIWCIIGWFIVSKLNLNGCSNELVTQTILAWTIIQLLLLICALSSRLVKRSKIIDQNEADFDEEGSVA